MGDGGTLELLAAKVERMDERLRKQEQLSSWVLGVAVGAGAILGFFADAIRSALGVGG